MFENYTYLRFDKTNVLRQGVLTPCQKVEKNKKIKHKNTIFIVVFRVLEITIKIKENKI